MNLTLKVIKITNAAGDGYAIIQTKASGMNQGVTTIAAFCGGNLGKRLAAQVAVQLADELMADELTFEEGTK
jgi:hypothetical protein